jgi:hypothetical protein
MDRNRAHRGPGRRGQLFSTTAAFAQMRKIIDMGIVKLSVRVGTRAQGWLLLDMPISIGPLAVYFR